MTAVARSDFRDALATILAAQQAATPALLRHVDRLGPANMGGEKPIGWQGEITDDFAYDSGTRAREMTMQVQVATTYPTDIAPDDFDDLMDALVERFWLPANVSIIDRAILELLRVEPSEFDVPRADGGSNAYRGALLTVRLRIWEGRD